MLHLKRNVHPYQWERCHVTDGYILTGDYYYEDDEDGLIISAKAYADMVKKKREEEWDYSRLENAANERDYKETLRKSYQEFQYAHILDRKVYGKGM